MNAPHNNSKNSSPSGQRRLFSFSIRSMLVIMALCGFGLFAKRQWDWQQKLKVVQSWTDDYYEQTFDEKDMDTPGGGSYVFKPPTLNLQGEEISKPEQMRMLTTAAIHLPSPKRQVAALKLLVELQGKESVPHVRQIALSRATGEVRVWALRLLGLQRDINDVNSITPLLKSNDAKIRGAAIDCLSLIRQPTYSIPPKYQANNIWTRSSPPIFISEYLGTSPRTPMKLPNAPDSSPPPLAFPAEIRQRFVDRMISSETLTERNSAAAALVSWPPKKYELRFAEWGVWVNDGGDLRLFQSIIDEIPPFVHGTGNSLDEIQEEKVNRMMFITKPIVHITCDQPMAAEIACQIRQGRPWFAFPRPDDFSISTRSTYFHRATQPPDTGIELIEQWIRRTDDDLIQPADPNITQLDDRGEGYRWLFPSHNKVAQMYRTTNEFVGTGVVWQNLIISPQKQSWTTPPTVPQDEKYNWWNRLREVPSSWVSNKGEAERFLYYDGPTDANSPVTAKLTGNQIEIASQQLNFHLEAWMTSATAPLRRQKATKARTKQLSLVVDVLNGNIRGQTIEHTNQSITSELTLPIAGKSVESKLLKLLVTYGLSEEEALGLIDVWRPQFFQTKGRRLLTILSANDYDQLCPLYMRPAPTELVRVGIVLTELAENEAEDSH